MRWSGEGGSGGGEGGLGAPTSTVGRASPLSWPSREASTRATLAGALDAVSQFFFCEDLFWWSEEDDEGFLSSCLWLWPPDLRKGLLELDEEARP